MKHHMARLSVLGGILAFLTLAGSGGTLAGSGGTLAGSGGTLAGSGVAAHHSFSVFNMETEIEVTGTVKQIDWTNPHIWIWIDVPNDQGGTDVWGLEGMSPNYLARRGWSRTTLEAGDEVTVSLRPLKSGENGGMFIRTTTPDGIVLTMGGAQDGE